MPYIRCDVKVGLSEKKKSQLAEKIKEITNRKLGSPIPYIHVAIRELPGTDFVESGEIDRLHNGYPEE